MVAYAKQYSTDNKEQVHHSQRKYSYRRKYNITIEEYDSIFKEQDGVCAICGEPQLNQRLAIDHDHTTGRIRALLCIRCNTWLGQLEKNQELFKKFNEYLIKHRR